MDAATHKKLDRCLKAYNRRFPQAVGRRTLEAKAGGGGFAYVTNKDTGEVARFDISAWRVRYVGLSKHSIVK